MKERLLKQVSKNEERSAGKFQDTQSSFETGGSAMTKDIEGKDLEVDLRNSKLSGIKMKTAVPRDEQEIDGDEILDAFNLDPRLIEQSKLLDRGELISYEKVRKQIDFAPTSMRLAQKADGDETVI